MIQVFHEYLDKFMVVYLDDIMVYNVMMEEYKEYLAKVFQKVMENQLYMTRDKCSFAKESIKFLSQLWRWTAWNTPTKEEVVAARSSSYWLLH